MGEGCNCTRGGGEGRRDGMESAVGSFGKCCAHSFVGGHEENEHVCRLIRYTFHHWAKVVIRIFLDPRASGVGP